MTRLEVMEQHLSPPKMLRERVFDDFDRDDICRNIHHMYEEKRLTVILEALQDDPFSDGCTSLAKLLKDVGVWLQKNQQQKVCLLRMHTLI